MLYSKFVNVLSSWFCSTLFCFDQPVIHLQFHLPNCLCPQSSFTSKEEEITQLEEVLNRWHDFADTNSKRLREAEQTHAFWEECPTKLMVLMVFITVYFVFFDHFAFLLVQSDFALIKRFCVSCNISLESWI